ncbi:MAG: DUF255 domain-containing protein [Chthonomonadaceae bacterium]|nr:DUF255 domain-containing protein [Chthonomonadaceae bacterium]
MGNRLAASTSLYLRQHASNPIAWHAWGEEAFEEAARRDCPVFLSVGYASCHWCHVMAHESFEDPDVARILNEHFVCVKVDREERPDVDEAYMLAVQLATGRGGWPMSVFLTPSRKPFLAATYVPKEPRGGHPGFQALCLRVEEAWRTERDALEAAAEEFSEAIARVQARQAPASDVGLSQLPDQAVAALAHDFDNRFGGFGDTPKFPPHTAIALLMACARRAGAEEMRSTAASMAHATLVQMIRGGIHDQVGGGFHRYSTDAAWLLPHFEKMLVDNALMLVNLGEAAESGTGETEVYRRTAARLVAWMERELRLPGGLYGSALDADSEGEEGRYYVWTEDEVRSALGDRAAAFLSAFGFEQDGNFADEATGERTGANIPHGVLNAAPFDADLGRLLEVRAERPPPALDDKAVVGWNALAMGALARMGFLDPALRLAEVLEGVVETDGGVPRVVSTQRPSTLGYLDDHAFAAQGFFRVAEATGDPRWSALAKRIVAKMVSEFEDPEGGFFATGVHHERLLGRTKPVFDQPAPSGNAVAVECLLRAGRQDAAERAVRSLAGWMAHAPQATEALLRATMPLIAQPGFAGFQEPVQIRLEPEAWAVEGDVARGRILITIAPGHHINSRRPPAKWLIPTSVEFEGLDATVGFPEDAELGWDGELELPVTLQVSGQDSFEVVVRYQACTEDVCLEPSVQRVAGRLRRS